MTEIAAVAAFTVVCVYGVLKVFLYGLLMGRHMTYQEATKERPTNPNLKPVVIKEASKEPLVPEAEFNQYAEPDVQ